jgi:hypothetical protein
MQLNSRDIGKSYHNLMRLELLALEGNKVTCVYDSKNFNLIDFYRKKFPHVDFVDANTIDHPWNELIF